jgi:hypothetical protein
MKKSITVAVSDGRSHAEMAADDPELMRLWGEINNAWDDIERLLYRAFDAMLIDVESSLTQAIFYSQRAHAARRDMVKELARCALMGKPEIQRKLQKVIDKRVRSCADDRHKLTHGAWGVTADLKDGSSGLSRIALEPNYFSKSNPAYTRQRLLQVRDKMTDTAKALQEAVQPLDEEKRSQLIHTLSRHMSRVTGRPVDLSQGLAASRKAAPKPAPTVDPTS